MKQWYVIGRAQDGEQLAYVVDGETADEAKKNFAADHPDLAFINIF
ncbi:hypothetical protein [Mycobacterium phage WXIN]|nr:hypothetical protein [Mycobacterium phage WXIN]